MKDYIKLILIFAVFFISINLESAKMTPPTFAYAICAVLLVFGAVAYKRHKSVYMKRMYTVVIAVQLVFFLALPYLVFKQSMALNNIWPLFPEVLWTAGGLLLWYYIISFFFLPVIVFIYGRRAWCSFICGTGAQSETLGDPYRTAGPKGEGVPGYFTAIKWILLAVTAAATVFALAGGSRDRLFGLFFLIFFVLILRTLVYSAINIILMPRLGNRIWCKYFCPQGLIIGLISRAGRFALIRDPSLCAGCGTCSRNCSMSIDIAGGPVVNKSGDCVGCGVCVEACPNNALSMTTDYSQVKQYRQKVGM